MQGTRADERGVEAHLTIRPTSSLARQQAPHGWLTPEFIWREMGLAGVEWRSNRGLEIHSDRSHFQFTVHDKLWVPNVGRNPLEMRKKNRWVAPAA